MSDRLKLWFAGRSLREKRLIVVMLALGVLTIVWGGIIRPLGDTLADARERHTAAVIALGEAETRVAAVRAMRGSAAASGQPLDATVRARAEAAGFALATLVPSGQGGVRATLTSARGGALLAWLAALERDGIIVDQLATTDNGDRTVSVQVALRGRGR